MNWKAEELKYDGGKLGKLFETFIFNEISSIIDANQNECQLYQYRDKDKREIDFIVESDNGFIIFLEVKAGSSINQNSFKDLEWFDKNIAKEKSFIGVVLYTGENILSFGKNMYAVPISYLWH